MANRIYIEKFLSEVDFHHYFSLVSDEKVMAMVTERGIPLEEARDNYKSLLEKNKAHKDFGSFKVFERDTNSFIGLGKLAINIEAFENHDSIKAESIMKQNWLRPMKEVYNFLVGKEKS